MRCPKCGKTKVYKYGHRPLWVRLSNGHKRKEMKQAYICDSCGHQWKDN